MTLTDIENEYTKLTNEFDTLFEEIIDNVSLDDKTLKDALKTQLPMQLQLESLSKRTNYLHDNAEIALDDEYGKAIKEVMSDGYKSVSITEAKMYAASNVDYKHARRVVTKVKRLRDEVKGSLDVINSRKYTLHNLTNALVAGVDRTIL